jgi:hypothetical protein
LDFGFAQRLSPLVRPYNRLSDGARNIPCAI